MYAHYIRKTAHYITISRLLHPESNFTRNGSQTKLGVDESIALLKLTAPCIPYYRDAV
jgi:hypothetical protein